VQAWKDARHTDPARRDQLMKLWVEAEVGRLGNLRAQSKREAGVPGPEGSVLKLGAGLLDRRIAELTVHLLGPMGMVSGPYSGSLGSGAPTDGHTTQEQMPTEPVMAFVAAQGSTIAGGTTEIQKNIVGERVLGLPREPGVDQNMPWNKIPRSV
jgi:alkylation response protein AidB-like acyl-CoA dehydrogenase